MSNNRMPYLLSTYRIDDRVVIQCESIENAETALSLIMGWLHSLERDCPRCGHALAEAKSGPEELVAVWKCSDCGYSRLR